MTWTNSITIQEKQLFTKIAERIYLEAKKGELNIEFKQFSTIIWSYASCKTPELYSKVFDIFEERITQKKASLKLADISCIFWAVLHKVLMKTSSFLVLENSTRDILASYIYSIEAKNPAQQTIAQMMSVKLPQSSVKFDLDEVDSWTIMNIIWGFSFVSLQDIGDLQLAAFDLATQKIDDFEASELCMILRAFCLEDIWSPYGLQDEKDRIFSAIIENLDIIYKVLSYDECIVLVDALTGCRHISVPLKANITVKLLKYSDELKLKIEKAKSQTEIDEGE